MQLRLLALLLLTAGLVAGCGSSSSSSSASSTPSPVTTTATTPASTSATTPTSTSAGAPTSVPQAVALCKARIAAAPTLPSNVKAQLLKLCDQAGSGNQAALRKLLVQ